MENKLHIEKQFSHSGLNAFIVEGLSPDEVDSIIKAASWDEQRSRLIELLNEYDNDYQPGHTLGTCWGCGYGIYDIRHFGGHLMVEVGSTCD